LSIPKEITRQHIEEGIRRWSPGDIEKLNPSIKFDLVFDGKKYPPMETIRQGHRMIPKAERPRFAGAFNGGVQANDFLIKRGFIIVDKAGKLIELGHAAGKHLPAVASQDDESSFPEGKQAYRLHLLRERDSAFIRRLKRRRQREAGGLCCEACHFCFESFYGEHGSGFIEAHHTIPVSRIPRGYKTKASDIKLVCSNCHRMLHRSWPWPATDKPRELNPRVSTAS
jgi:hypothetical protein